MRNFVYRILEIPFIYRLVLVILAPGSEYFLKKYFQLVFEGSKGLVLDAGCGPKLNTPRPEGRLVGADINPKYIKNYCAAEDQAGVVALGEELPFKNDVFDESRCFGVMHHLPEEMNVKFVREMIRCTRSNGRVIIVDGIMPKVAWLRPIAWAINKLDRGQWKLSEEKLETLIHKAHDGKWTKINRQTFTLFGNEVIAFIYQKI